jgi:plastocyanin
MRTWIAALAAGVLAALLVSGLPASAADQQIAAQASSWSPNAVTISQGESVTWTNGGGFHNVCVQKPGTPGDACDEFTNGPVDNTWTSANHAFASPGTYAFFCAAHKSSGMTGTITVEPPSTGTSTTPPPDTMPTDTTTSPAQVEQNTIAEDKTAPSFTGKLKRKSSRRSLIVELGSSKDAALDATVFRRAPGARSFRRVGAASMNVKAGRNTVTLPRKAAGKMRSGAYRVKLALEDAAGNRSGTRVLNFKIN